MHLSALNVHLAANPHFVEMAAFEPDPEFSLVRLLSVERTEQGLRIEIRDSQKVGIITLAQTEYCAPRLWVRIFPDPFTEIACRSLREPYYQIRGINFDEIEL